MGNTGQCPQQQRVEKLFAELPVPGPEFSLGIGCYGQQVDEHRWRIPKTGAMRVPGLVFAGSSLIKAIQGDQSLAQVVNVATLPGIVGNALAMPDIHWGYGFAIGGVAAFSPDNGVVSPGGVGFDIN